MRDSTHCTSKEKDEVEDALERLVQFGSGFIPPRFLEAASDLLVAKAYKDTALIQSYIKAFLEAYRDFIQETLPGFLGTPEQFKNALSKAWEAMKSRPPQENYDHIGESIKSAFERVLTFLDSFQDAIDRVQKNGYTIDEKQVEQLRTEIGQLRTMKESVLRDWPWSTQELPPLNREMVAKARSQKGEPIQDLIRRLGGDPAGSR